MDNEPIVAETLEAAGFNGAAAAIRSDVAAAANVDDLMTRYLAYAKPLVGFKEGTLLEETPGLGLGMGGRPLVFIRWLDQDFESDREIALRWAGALRSDLADCMVGFLTDGGQQFQIVPHNYGRLRRLASV